MLSNPHNQPGDSAVYGSAGYMMELQKVNKAVREHGEGNSCTMVCYKVNLLLCHECAKESYILGLSGERNFHYFTPKLNVLGRLLRRKCHVVILEVVKYKHFLVMIFYSILVN